MKLPNAVKNMSELQKLTFASIVVSIVLSAAVLVAVVKLVSSHERVVLVPPHLDEKVEVSWRSADAVYMKSFGLYVATLIGNIQPKTSKVVLDTVGVFMDTDIYNEFRTQARSIIDDPVFKISGAVITFQPSAIQYEPESSRVFVTGALITKSATSHKSKNVVYEIGLQIRNGRPWVYHFTSYDGSTPHTMSWHIQKAEKEGTKIPDHIMPGFKPGGPPAFIAPVPPDAAEAAQVQEATPIQTQPPVSDPSGNENSSVVRG